MRKPAAPAPIIVKVGRLPHSQGLPLPAYQTDHAAGMDLLAAIAADMPITMAPGTHVMVPTGLSLELPPGTEAQVRPRSGLAAKFAVTVLNSPGTIDSDYRGEVQVLLINHGSAPFRINRGDRIAQVIIATVTRAELVEAKTPLTKTSRGAGGFGSTGVSHAPQRKKTIPRLARSEKQATRSKRNPKKS